MQNGDYNIQSWIGNIFIVLTWFMHEWRGRDRYIVRSWHTCMQVFCHSKSRLQTGFISHQIKAPFQDYPKREVKKMLFCNWIGQLFYIWPESFLQLHLPESSTYLLHVAAWGPKVTAALISINNSHFPCVKYLIYFSSTWAGGILRWCARGHCKSQMFWVKVS